MRHRRELMAQVVVLLAQVCQLDVDRRQVLKGRLGRWWRAGLMCLGRVWRGVLSLGSVGMAAFGPELAVAMLLKIAADFPAGALVRDLLGLSVPGVVGFGIV